MTKLPLEILKDKYIPIVEMPDKYGISVSKVMTMIKSRRIKYAEFKAPGDIRRSIHVNPEDVLRVIEEESHESNSSI